MGRWYNPFMIWLLRSPLHGMAGKGLMLISVTGCKSGKPYTTPINYVRASDRLMATSTRDRTWWRNLRGGAPVTLRLEGREVKGFGEVFVDEASVAEHLARYFGCAPQYARLFNVRLESDGKPNGEDVARAARERVFIEVQLPSA